MIDENAAIVQLMKDYQDNGRRIAGLTHAVNRRVKAIDRLTDLLKENVCQVTVVEGGFRVPSEAPAVISQKDVPFDTLSIEALHEELAALAVAIHEAKQLQACMRTAGFPDLKATGDDKAA